MQQQNESPTENYRTRCYVCYRPQSACFCDAIPTIENRTDILILQHVKERFHAFNTARIVRHALQNCNLVVDQTPKLATSELPFADNTGVLYPGKRSRLLSDLPQNERPQQLVILDGTWHHAKTFMQQIPALRQLPRFHLSPQSPSTYRIRKEPTETAVSTLEATVQALQILEPQINGLDQLLLAFDRMIDTQLQHPRDTGRQRNEKRRWKPPANIPSVLLNGEQDVVVAYGEAAHGQSGIRTKNKEPIYWVAQRLADGANFECAIGPQRSLSSDFLQQIELEESDFLTARSRDEFAALWRKFIRPTDTVVTYNAGTLRLLNACGVETINGFSLKSVNLNRDCRMLGEVITRLNLTPTAVPQRGRAGKRLANAIAYTRYLSELGRGLTD